MKRLIELEPEELAKIILSNKVLKNMLIENFYEYYNTGMNDFMSSFPSNSIEYKLDLYSDIEFKVLDNQKFISGVKKFIHKFGDDLIKNLRPTIERCEKSANDKELDKMIKLLSRTFVSHSIITKIEYYEELLYKIENNIIDNILLRYLNWNAPDIYDDYAIGDDNNIYKRI